MGEAPAEVEAEPVSFEPIAVVRTLADPDDAGFETGYSHAGTSPSAVASGSAENGLATAASGRFETESGRAAEATHEGEDVSEQLAAELREPGIEVGQPAPADDSSLDAESHGAGNSEQSAANRPSGGINSLAAMKNIVAAGSIGVTKSLTDEEALDRRGYPDTAGNADVTGDSGPALASDLAGTRDTTGVSDLADTSDEGEEPGVPEVGGVGSAAVGADAVLVDSGGFALVDDTEAGSGESFTGGLSEAVWSAAWADWQSFGGHGDLGGLSEADWGKAWSDWQNFGGHGDLGGLSKDDWGNAWTGWQSFGGNGQTETPGPAVTGDTPDSPVADGDTPDSAIVDGEVAGHPVVEGQDTDSQDAEGQSAEGQVDSSRAASMEASRPVEGDQAESDQAGNDDAENDAAGDDAVSVGSAETAGVDVAVVEAGTEEGGAPVVPAQGVTVGEGSAGSAAEAGVAAASREILPEAKAGGQDAEQTGEQASDKISEQAGEQGGENTGKQAEEQGRDRAGSVSSERLEPVRQRRGEQAPADRRRAEPERILASYPWVFDPRTLRETVGEPERLGDLADRLSDRLEFAERDNVRAGLLSLRAAVSRVLGELDDALADGREGLRHAEASGEFRTVAIAQARLAHVLHWRGEFDEADRLYARAESVELPSAVRAEISELAGRSVFDQGRLLEAVNHFERALDVRQGEDPELVERIELALDEITRRSADGWGPYPRTRDEVLEVPKAPMRLLDDGAGLWGYAAAVEPQFAEAQPFAEGVAWVRRPGAPAWELIDTRGELVIPAAHDYRAVGPFAEGLAWVRRDDSGWFAIDLQNRLIVTPAGFEDARPFRSGLAVVRQGGAWGAVDRNGRIAVRPAFHGFLTVLHVGGSVDGFTDEGLAVVDAGDRFGVVDRAGQLVVPPVHAAVVIHPSAFLVRDPAGSWGALNRRGEPLVDVVHKDRDSAVEQLPGEARPVL
ncbi:WG repeat-containing protein [Actinoplanes derwentensis]|uniref:WG repeat-containing protein n=1 Tax=Actinoplanes derwentensis TaxID=113562 RepID=UPI0012FDC595|nr:WG repeat-containing protein [Actinoplanes derwentensis]